MPTKNSLLEIRAKRQVVIDGIILENLLKAPPAQDVGLSILNLKEETGFSRSILDRALARLVERGAVVVVPRAVTGLVGFRRALTV